jgi:hypothetical protein
MEYRKWRPWIAALALAALLSGCSLGGGTAASDPASPEESEAPALPTESADTKMVRLGTSHYGIEISRDFTNVNISNEEWEDDMVAHYHNENTLQDFVVYQFSKEDYPDTLEGLIQEEAEAYEATEVVTDMTINDIPVMYYSSTGNYGGVYRNSRTFAFENGDEYIEIDFWFVGYLAEDESWDIIRSLTKTGSNCLSLGKDGAYQIWIPDDFTPVANAAADIAVYENGSGSVHLYIGSVPNEKQTLNEYVRSRGGSNIETDAEVNGIPAAFYRSVEALDGAYHSVRTCVLAEKSDGANIPTGFITLAFRLDGITSESEMAGILETLSVA